MLYRQISTADRLPKRKGPYFVKVKKPEDSMIIFKNLDIYMWLDGPEEPQRELWLNTFECWLEPIEDDGWVSKEIAEIIIKVDEENFLSDIEVPYLTKVDEMAKRITLKQQEEAQERYTAAIESVMGLIVDKPHLKDAFETCARTAAGLETTE